MTNKLTVIDGLKPDMAIYDELKDSIEHDKEGIKLDGAGKPVFLDSIS